MSYEMQINDKGWFAIADPPPWVSESLRIHPTGTVVGLEHAGGLRQSWRARPTPETVTEAKAAGYRVVKLVHVGAGPAFDDSTLDSRDEYQIVDEL